MNNVEVKYYKVLPNNEYSLLGQSSFVLNETDNLKQSIKENIPTLSPLWTEGRVLSIDYDDYKVYAFFTMTPVNNENKSDNKVYEINLEHWAPNQDGKVALKYYKYLYVLGTENIENCINKYIKNNLPGTSSYKLMNDGDGGYHYGNGSNVSWHFHVSRAQLLNDE